MPNIAQVSGASVHVFPNDHPPPHVHALHQGRVARLRISDASVMDSSHGFPAGVLRDVRAWLLENRYHAAAVWARYHP
jgi:hypothetical protein